jgi:hypothetical protein
MVRAVLAPVLNRAHCLCRRHDVKWSLHLGRGYRSPTERRAPPWTGSVAHAALRRELAPLAGTLSS